MSNPETFDPETHFKVRVPVERTIRLRDAEREMVLAEDVKTDRGQLLFPERTVLDAERINKLRNFSIRTVRVEDTETRWVDEGTYQNLTGETEVLEKKRIPTEPDPKSETEPEDETNPETVSSAFNFLESTESPKRISEFVRELTENLEGENQEDLLESVEELSGRTESVEDLFRYLLRQIGNLEDSEKRKTLLNELYDLGTSGHESSDTDEEIDLPVDLETKLDQLDDEKQSLRTGILDFLHGNPEALTVVSEEEVPDADLQKSPVDADNLPEEIRTDLDNELLQKLVPLLLDWIRNRDSSDDVEETFEDVLDSDHGDSLRDLVRNAEGFAPKLLINSPITWRIKIH